MIIKIYDKLAIKYDYLTIKKYEYVAPLLLFNLLRRYIKKGETILDLGIGTGQSSILFKKMGLKIFGIDGSKNMLIICKRKNITRELKNFDLNNKKFPYKKMSFDHVIGVGLFYYFYNLDNFFFEAQRILKIHGTFSFIVEDNVDGDNNIKSRIFNYQNKKINIFKHSKEYIDFLSHKAGFIKLKSVSFWGYNNKTRRKDILMKIYIFQKIIK